MKQMTVIKHVQVWANQRGIPSATTFSIEERKGEFTHLLIENYMLKSWGIHPSNFTQVKVDHKIQ